MGIHTIVSGMGASTISGITITNTGMGIQDHMQVSQDILTTGVIEPTSFFVSAAGGNLNVNVSSGAAYILNPSFSLNSITVNKYFRVISDSSPQLVAHMAAADSTNPRIDLVCLKTTGNAPDGTASNIFTVAGSADDITLKGTASASPIIPATPAGYFLLAYVTLTANSTVIAQVNITDMRQILGVGEGSGWSPMSGVFTRSTSSIINTPTNYDPTKILRIGDKLRYYDGITNQLNNIWTYAYIIGLSTSTITVIYDSNSGTLSNNPLNIGYAKSNAVGFPYYLSYVPTFSSSNANATIGNGSILGNFKLVDNVCYMELAFTAGSTTGFGTGDYYFGYPIPPVSHLGIVGNNAIAGNAYVEQAGITGYLRILRGATSTQFKCGDTSNVSISNSSPFSWLGTRGDFAKIDGYYFIA